MNFGELIQEGSATKKQVNTLSGKKTSGKSD